MAVVEDFNILVLHQFVFFEIMIIHLILIKIFPATLRLSSAWYAESKSFSEKICSVNNFNSPFLINS